MSPSEPSSELHIVILAAGKGSRMRSNLPKVLHCVGGKPLLAHVIDSASALKPAKLHIIIGHGKGQVKSAFDGTEVNWIEQEKQLGTGDAVKQALPFIPDNAHVLMLTADVPLIKTATLKLLCDSMAAFPLALLTAIMPDPTGLGRIVRDQAGLVTGIVEQKDANSEQQKIHEINSGIMCARSQELKDWLNRIDTKNAQGEYYLTDIVGLAHTDSCQINALAVDNPADVDGINSRVQLAKVERSYQIQRVSELMQAGVTVIDPSRLDIRGSVSVGTDTQIDINCVIEDSTIGENVSIGPNCVISNSKIGSGTMIYANTVIESAELSEDVSVGPFARLRPGTKLARDVRIGNFVETKNAKLDTGAKANHLSYVGDSTVGKNTNIGAGVITCNYDGANKHQTTIGDDVFVGSDSQLVAPVEIEDGATIGAGSTITNKVERDQLAISRARQRQIDGWQRPTKNDKKK
ncbi:MAG: bifunctional UDP-N-acetylglucosamine diphosphorylase/glucosamine-1-phosphate N-acetyltransferase GlmU [Acidiferrobacterales bacterium]|nr:bifunctional UDP-N-acetylglucosamine diphosphorylase/glucosamine-1-phosphate N-acetyltransferase GlmU [Acidiferrobacterales bacterium]